MDFSSSALCHVTLHSRPPPAPPHGKCPSRNSGQVKRQRKSVIYSVAKTRPTWSFKRHWPVGVNNNQTQSYCGSSAVMLMLGAVKCRCCLSSYLLRYLNAPWELGKACQWLRGEKGRDRGEKVTKTVVCVRARVWESESSQAILCLFACCGGYGRQWPELSW